MHFWETAAENWGQVPWLQLGWAVWSILALALLFDFLNGFHDSANSVATVVSTRVLSPQVAVLWATFFNFIAFLVFKLTVADTIKGDIVNEELIRSNRVIAATLIAACFWDIITWYWGLPTSSSHALIGGLIGASVAHTGGLHVLKWNGIGLIVLFIFLAPLVGMFFGTAMGVAVAWIFRRCSPRRVDRIFRRGQLLSASLYSLGHGGNDAQKTMGIIFLLLVIASRTGPVTFQQPTQVPTEVVLACHAAMGLGTLCGGWRIVKTMGQKIIHLRPVDGFCAETGAAATLALTIMFRGIPVSTTHTITGAIVGVGSLRRLSAVRWGVAERVVWAWILTIPATAAIGALSWLVLPMFN